jgi:hypothetical protein
MWRTCYGVMVYHGHMFGLHKGDMLSGKSLPKTSIDPIWVTSLEESLSITTGRCDLAIATHARKML